MSDTLDLQFDIDDDGPHGLRLVIVDGDDVLWPRTRAPDEGARFDAEEILSFLVDAWPSIILSETWPAIFEGTEPASITGLLRAAEDRWEQFRGDDADAAEQEAARIETFLYCHDLSSMAHGADLEPFYFLRQRAKIRIETWGQVLFAGFHQFVSGLARLGDRTCAMLAVRDETADLRTRWAARDIVDPAVAASLVSGLPAEDILPSARSAFTLALQSLPLVEIANDNAEPLMAAARSSGPLGPKGLEDVVAALLAMPHGSTAALAPMQRAMKASLAGLSSPTDQGVRAAHCLRDHFDLPNGRVDLRSVSDRLGIAVIEKDWLDGRLDGLATAGPRHGPAVVLNRATHRRARHDTGLEQSLRFTWAHEIGHILLDGEDWPAIVDAARQRVPRKVETRANAFATELLLPASLAFQRLDSSRWQLRWADLEPLLNGICQEFGLPRITAARQVARGAPDTLKRDLRAVFEATIPNFGEA